MYKRKFKTNIAIIAMKSKQKLDDATAMDVGEGKAFVDSTFDLLTEVASKGTGNLLLQEIEATRRAVIIFRDDQSGKGSAALPYPGTAANEIGRFIKLRQIPTNAVSALQKANPSYVPPTMQNYAAEFHKVLEASKVDRNLAASLIGLTRDDLDAIELGTKQLPPEAYHRFAMAFYQWLTPGDGCSVGLRFDPGQVSTEDPAVIILGHEMVHVWRMVTGMRVFLGGWEEEAMTTGIPPFLNMKFSENKLRAEQGVPLRTKYTALCGTAHYQTVNAFDGKGIWPEHVRAWDEWQKANPKLAEKKIKLTKKSVFSSPIKNIFGR